MVKTHDLVDHGGGPTGIRSCLAPHSAYSFNGLVTTWSGLLLSIRFCTYQMLYSQCYHPLLHLCQRARAVALYD